MSPKLLLALWILTVVGCSGRGEAPSPAADSGAPVHLEDELEQAEVVGSEIPPDLPAAREWQFDSPRPEWQTVADATTVLEAIPLDDALRLELSPAEGSSRRLWGGIYAELAGEDSPAGWHPGDWDYVLLRARSNGGLRKIGLKLNRQGAGNDEEAWQVHAEEVDAINDGAYQSYLMRVDIKVGKKVDLWQQMAIHAYTEGPTPATLEIQSIRVIPKAARFLAAPLGQEIEGRGGDYRRVLYTHTPARLTYKLRIPPAGRLDFGLGVLQQETPVRFEVRAKPEDQPALTLFAETWSDRDRWGQRSVDLSAFGGQTIDLTLATDAEHAGALALWAAPTVSGSEPPRKPNIILYVIDGGGADYMSVYGYSRQTTPNLERLAAQGAVFERAFSNSGWTKPSTASMVTSLQHSVLGGFRTFSDPLPDQAETMAEHLHRAGYQTAVFVSNPFAGRMSSLDRGVDALRDSGTPRNSDSSAQLHEDFWAWREAYPGQPFWVHFQTTDVHSPHLPVQPFADRFGDSGLRQRYNEWRQRLDTEGGSAPDSPAWQKTGIDRTAFYAAEESFFAECMAHNDHQLGRLIERLEAEGEWQNTLLIVTADHGVQAAGLRLDGIASPRRVLASAWETRIPLIVVWPGRIAPARYSDPVSLVDILPTVLELTELPPAEVVQGHSLAPLLRGEAWQPAPVILDEFEHDAVTGELKGVLEIVDGRWAASLEIAPAAENAAKQLPPLLLFDLEQDPFCLHSVHDEHPDLAQKYNAELRRVWLQHRELAKRYSRSQDTHLASDQLQTLRSLGYIQ